MMKNEIVIRPTTEADIERVCVIYVEARRFMRSRGNHSQWSDSYPSAASLRADIEQGGSYVCISDGKIVATFFFTTRIEPTYAHIYEGNWLNQHPYGTIHRVATDGSVKGIMDYVTAFCSSLCDNLRIDTHSDNHVMQQAILRNGFKRCGIIYLADGAPRIAYQRDK